MNVCFETFGCRLNRAEALEREAEYLAKGWKIVSKHADADLFIIRGCSVTRRAQHECEKLIIHLQRHYPLKKIIIEGCLPKATPTPARETSTLPMRTARAYLKIQDGCNGKCTFCIVPKFRGASRSESFTEIIDRAKRFIDADYHEIVITGCNLSLFASEGKRLPELTQALAELSPECRIRIGSIEPGKCAEELVHVIYDNGNCCRFLHIPVQSGSNRTLTAMKRPYLIDDVENLVNEATLLMPTIGIGCDLMTGFPGETDFDFLATVGLLKRFPFTNAHIFPYSSRPDTIAAASLDKISREIRHQRAKELSEIAKESRHRYARKFMHDNVTVLIEDAKRRTGWTGEYLKCTILGDQPLERRHLYHARVVNIKGDSLTASVIHK